MWVAKLWSSGTVQDSWSGGVWIPLEGQILLQSSQTTLKQSYNWCKILINEFKLNYHILSWPDQCTFDFFSEYDVLRHTLKRMTYLKLLTVGQKNNASITRNVDQYSQYADKHLVCYLRQLPCEYFHVMLLCFFVKILILYVFKHSMEILVFDVFKLWNNTKMNKKTMCFWIVQYSNTLKYFWAIGKN